MNKKIRSILIIALLAIFCLGVMASCKTEKVDIFDYSADNLGIVAKLIKVMRDWIGNYGWTVVVFTVFLKIVMLPLDFWQRFSSRKNSLKMQRLQPYLEAIDKRYGANTPRSNDEKQKLYKKNGGTGMLSMCLPMILSMVIFFVVFAGLREYSKFRSIESFTSLADNYYQTYYDELAKDVEIKPIIESARDAAETSYKTNKPNASDIATRIIANNAGVGAAKNDYAEKCDAAKEIAIKSVQEHYVATKESWLWIQSIWQPDTWAPIMPEYTSRTNGFSTEIDMNSFPDGNTAYETIRNAVLKTGERGTEGKWNGLMILPILSIALSFLSMFITQLMEKKNRKDTAPNPQQAASNKVMMILMPLMMAYFGFIYTGAFAIYMVTNYFISIISTVALRVPIEKLVEKQLSKMEKENNTGKASYMR